MIANYLIVGLAILCLSFGISLPVVYNVQKKNYGKKIQTISSDVSMKFHEKETEYEDKLHTIQQKAKEEIETVRRETQEELQKKERETHEFTERFRQDVENETRILLDSKDRDTAKRISKILEESEKRINQIESDTADEIKKTNEYWRNELDRIQLRMDYERKELENQEPKELMIQAMLTLSKYGIRLERLDKGLTGLQSTAKEQVDQVLAVKGNIDTVFKELEKILLRISDTRSKVDELLSERADLTEELDDLQTKIDDLQDDVHELTDDSSYSLFGRLMESINSLAEKIGIITDSDDVIPKLREIAMAVEDIKGDGYEVSLSALTDILNEIKHTFSRMSSDFDEVQSKVNDMSEWLSDSTDTPLSELKDKIDNIESIAEGVQSKLYDLDSWTIGEIKDKLENIETKVESMS